MTPPPFPTRGRLPGMGVAGAQEGKVSPERQQGEAVGHERRRLQHVRQLGGIDPAGLDDLAVGEAERPVVRRRGSSGRGGRRRRPRTARRRSRSGTLIDADLLGELPTGGVVVGLAGSDDTADAEVPATGPEVLVLAAAVDQQLRRAATARRRRRRGGGAARPASAGASPWPRRGRRCRRRRRARRQPGPRSDAYHGPMTLDTTSLREAANDLLEPAVELRRTLHEWPEVGNELPVTRDHVLGGDRGPAARRHHARDHQRDRRHAHRRRAGPDDPPARRHGCAADARGHRSRLRLEGRRARCTPAATTRTRPCWSARRSCSPNAATSSAGRVLFMFQPGEEGHHGARFMLDEGLLDVPPLRRRHPSPITGAFAIHITSSLPSGWMSSRGGSIMASADTMTITVTGKGGHASEPHRAVDPIPVACEIVQALQTDGHPHGRRLRPLGGHGRPDHRRHDQQRDPGDGDDPGHHPRRQREDPGQGPRRHPPRRRRRRRGARLRGGRRHRRRLPGHRQRRRRSPTTVLDVAGQRRRRGQGRAPAAPGDGRRGLELRPAARAGGDDVPRRHPPRPQPRPPPHRTTPTGCCSTSRRWSTASPPTPPSPSTTSASQSSTSWPVSRACERASASERAASNGLRGRGTPRAACCRACGGAAPRAWCAAWPGRRRSSGGSRPGR